MTLKEQLPLVFPNGSRLEVMSYTCKKCNVSSEAVEANIAEFPAGVFTIKLTCCGEESVYRARQTADAFVLEKQIAHYFYVFNPKKESWFSKIKGFFKRK